MHNTCLKCPLSVIEGVHQAGLLLSLACHKEVLLLGPLLIVFINDLSDALSHGSSAIYADDTKLHRTMSSTTDRECQQESFSLNTWNLESNIKFNTSKCKVLSVTRKKNAVSFNYCWGFAALFVSPNKLTKITITQ